MVNNTVKTHIFVLIISFSFLIISAYSLYSFMKFRTESSGLFFVFIVGIIIFGLLLAIIKHFYPNSRIGDLIKNLIKSLLENFQ